MSGLPKVMPGVSSTAGMLNQDLQRVQLAVNPPASLLLTQVVGADQRMAGEKKIRFGSLFSSRRKPIIFLKDSLQLL